MCEPVVCSTAGACSKSEVGEDDDDHEKRESCHSHQASVSDVSRALRFDAGDGSNRGEEYGEAKPCEPAHTNDSIDAAGETCSIELRSLAPPTAKLEAYVQQRDFDRAEPRQGREVEVATIGNEGMVGLPVFLGTSSTPGIAYAPVPGDSFRIKA